MLAYNLILFGTLFLIAYAYRAVHIVTANYKPSLKRVLRIGFPLISLGFYASSAYIGVNFESLKHNKALVNYAVISGITNSVTLLSISIFQLVSDIMLLLRFGAHKAQASNAGKPLPRRRFMSQLAIGVGAIMLGSFVYGTTWGKYGWRIITNKLSFKNLPQSFDGTRIVQISDLHLGSFNNNYEPLKEAVQLINDLKPDYIVFTGDLINEKPNETEGWIEVFNQLQANFGKYAILGNHDYGWGDGLTDDDKTKNSMAVADVCQQMGFEILLNKHVILNRGGEKIGLVGVENWGYSQQNWFPTKGDYKKATENMEQVPFKILLSHDPTHWDHKILGQENVDLTLAGHTHGGQMGIHIPGLPEICAGRLFYDRYAGAYSENNQHLYVNRGMGFLIFPGRVGMPPEVTLHVLSVG